MNLSQSFEHFDQLIVNHAQGSYSLLRPNLMTIREQVEALEAEHASLKNDHKVLKNQTEHAKTEMDKEKAQLEAKIAVLEKQIAESTSQHSSKSPLVSGDIDVLKAFFERNTAMQPREVAHVLTLKEGVAAYHCEKLFGLAYLTVADSDQLEGPMPYAIASKGRRYLVENHLV